jgi:DNA polymerase III epsilon subunit-like protein
MGSHRREKRNNPFMVLVTFILKTLAVLLFLFAVLVIATNLNGNFIFAVILAGISGFIGYAFWSLSNVLLGKGRSRIQKSEHSESTPPTITESVQYLDHVPDSVPVSDTSNYRNQTVIPQSPIRVVAHDSHDLIYDTSPVQYASIIKPSRKFRKAARVADMAVIDVETTGFGNSSEIIDIGVALVRDEKVLATYSQLVKPNQLIGTFINNLTGISNDQLASQPFISQVLPGLLDEIRVLPLMGHNVGFDIRMLNAAAEFIGIPGLEPSGIIDTKDLSIDRFPGASSHTLEDLIERVGIDESQQHRALSDVIQDFRCYLAMQKMTEAKPITQQQEANSQLRKKQKEKLYFRSMWMEGHDMKPVNTKPSGPEISAEGGVDINGEENHQPLLEKYGKGTWLWVSARKGRIAKGKYDGYPTVYVSLDGHEIGHISKYQMERHFNHIPDKEFIAKAHIRDKVSNTKLELRVEFPKEHLPIDLTPYVVKKVKPKPVQPKKVTSASTIIRQQETNTVVTNEPVNRKAHKRVLQASVAYRMSVAQDCQKELGSYPALSWVWVSLSIHKSSSPTTVYITLDGETINSINIDKSSITERISSNGAIAKAHIITVDNQLELEVYLPE